MLEISDLETREIIMSRQQKIKALTSFFWAFVCNICISPKQKTRVFHDEAHTLL